jgi:hypothetical protein
VQQPVLEQLYVPPTAWHPEEDTYCALHHPHVEKYDVQPFNRHKIMTHKVSVENVHMMS